MSEVSHEELTELRKQLETNSSAMTMKIDAIALSVNLVHNMLAEAKGANLPARFEVLEDKVSKMKESQDQRIELPSQVKRNQDDIRTLFKFQYMATGILIFLQIVLTILGKFAVDAIFHPAVSP
jgi:hypothetical protein